MSGPDEQFPPEPEVHRPGAAEARSADVRSGGAPRTDRSAAENRTAAEEQTPAEGSAEVAATVARLTADDLAPPERRRLLARLAGHAGQTGWRMLARPRSAFRWISDTLLQVAPRIPIRDLETLRRHYPGLDGEALAERLVRNASRVTATVGAAGGGLSAVQWSAPPTLLSAPVLLASETVVVVAVELKLLGELHELYRLPIAGSSTQRATALVSAWAGRRGVSLTTAGLGLSASLGMAARRELRDRLLRRLGRNLTTLGPLLTGAAVGGELNRRATRSVGNDFRQDLRRLAATSAAQAPLDGTVVAPDTSPQVTDDRRRPGAGSS